MRRRTIRILLGVSLLAFLSLPRSASADDAGVLVGPQELSAGGRSSVTLTTLDSATRDALARPFTVRLLRDSETVATLSSGATGPDGHVRIPFDVPDLEPGSYVLEAEVDGMEERLRIETAVTKTPAILIETDKPIYKPSQTIQGRILLVDNALRPTAGEAELSIHDAKGIRIDRRTLTAGEYGVADFSLDLASEVNFGVWKLRVRSEGVESVRDIRVEEYTLPRFELGVDLPRDWALVDQEIAGTVDARYFFGEDVEGRARVRAERWVGSWEEYASSEGDLQGGELSFTLPPVGFVAGSPRQGGQGSVTLFIEVTDSTGHTQETTEVLTIVQSPVVLSLIPRVRYLKPGIPFDALVTAESPDGEPLDAGVRVTASYQSAWGGEVGNEELEVEVAGGRGTVELHPPEEAFLADLWAQSSTDGRTSTTSVRVEGTYSSGGSFLSLAREGASGPAPVGATVEFSTTATHPGTVYYEVYAGGRTVLSDAVESDRFAFAVTPEMAPKARVVAYKINPDNEVAADSLTIEVGLPSSITVSAAFDREKVRPGDSVEVTIDSGTGARALLGVSIVDESVLALGRSRLHLAEVFAELERRFLEPRAEVHEKDGEPVGGGPIGGPAVDGFFGPARSRGALDIIEEAGLAIATSRGIAVNEGFQGFWPEVADDVVLAPGADGDRSASSTPPESVRVRQYFPETWVWQPTLLTDENGTATLTLTVPDSITGWKLSAVGSSDAGIGFGEAELTAFQEFFVEPSLPYSVTRGEEFPIKVDVFNYLEEDQTVSLEFGEGDWYELLGEGALEVTVPGSSATSVHFPIRPTLIGEHDLQITALGSLSDAVRRQIIVEPEGVPSVSVTNSVIRAGESVPLDLSFPPLVVPGSERAFLHITPSPVAQTMNGISDLLGMPYGCGEQNMIFLAPDIEILKYLREIGELSTEIRATAEYYVNVGYQRELTFQTDDGGFAAFGGAEGSLWLTAFVLSTFSGAREVRDIDETVLERAASMLVSRQRNDGSFQTDDFLIHKEMDGGLENEYAMAAYVTNALADYAAGGSPPSSVTEALSLAAGYLRDARSAVNDDAYALSIAAGALQKVAGFEAEAEAVIDRLIELANDDGIGLHWKPYPVETTGYVAMALLASNGGAGRPEAQLAIDWLSTQRNALGGYGASTQDTVVAIRALFSAARKVNRELDVHLTLLSGSAELWSLDVDSSNFDVLHSTSLPVSKTEGLELRASGSGSVGYQVARKFHLPGETLPPPSDMLIDVRYDSEGIEVDDILDVHVRLLYRGDKPATGMVIADIGVPTGFSALRDSIDRLVDAGTVSRAEVAGRKVIFYVDSLIAKEPLEFEFRMRALYPVRAEGPLSRAYEYYDPEVEGFHRSEDLTIADLAPIEFVRGDANADGSVDLSDAVSVLGHLFRGETGLRCRDAGDVNDDGALNITDPIYLLQHLFLGGSPPVAPYPDAGEDTTEDGLDCRRRS